MKNMKSLKETAFWLSVVAAVLDQILGLAGTQWAMVAILLAVYAVYFEHASCGMDNNE